jgi:hypothetical protein
MSRLDIIQYLIRVNKYKKYLEIGCDRDQVFKNIKIFKVGVDPVRGGTKRMTSDRFFMLNKVRFDIIFIDGLHHADQVYKDINNALKILEPNGTIVVHDCNPVNYRSQLVPRITKIWNGDVWKAWVRLRYERDDISMKCIDTDYGCGIITFDKQIKIEKLVTDYNEFVSNKQYLLNLVSETIINTKKPISNHHKINTKQKESSSLKSILGSKENRNISIISNKKIEYDPGMSYIVSGDSGAGHAIQLGVSLRKLMPLTAVYYQHSGYGFDYIDPLAKYGFSNIPLGGNQLIIVSAHCYIMLLKQRGKNFFKNWKQIKIILTDGVYVKYHKILNKHFRNYTIFSTPCRIHYRGNLPTLEYYQPFDFSNIEINKNKIITASHSPFTKTRFKLKGTDKIVDIFNKYNVNYDLIYNDNWTNCIQRKAKTHIFVDQIECTYFVDMGDNVWKGGVGKSGLEAMKLKCLTISSGQYISKEIPIPPVAWCDVNTYEKVFEKYLKDEQARNNMIEQQYQWAQKYLDPDFCAKRVYYGFSEERKKLII